MTVSYTHLLTFFITTVCALIFAGVIGSVVYHMGAFNAVDATNIAIKEGTVGTNPLSIVMSIVPNNFVSALTNNGGVLAIVFLAVSVGLAMNQLKEKTKTVKKLFIELSDIISVCLSFVINKFAPIAIFCLLTRTFAAYGIDYLMPALAYVITVVIALFAYLFIAYPLYLMIMAKLNPCLLYTSTYINEEGKEYSQRFHKIDNQLMKEIYIGDIEYDENGEERINHKVKLKNFESLEFIKKNDFLKYLNINEEDVYKRQILD